MGGEGSKAEGGIECFLLPLQAVGHVGWPFEETWGGCQPKFLSDKATLKRAQATGEHIQLRLLAHTPHHGPINKIRHNCIRESASDWLPLHPNLELSP